MPNNLKLRSSDFPNIQAKLKRDLFSGLCVRKRGFLIADGDSDNDNADLTETCPRFHKKKDQS